VFNSRQDTVVVLNRLTEKNKNKMTDMVSIGQFTVDEQATSQNQPRWTLTMGQFSVNQQLYSTSTSDRKEKRKSPRFAFLKISSTAHCTHLQSRSSQPTTQALQKSAFLSAH
jgi:hypothetical protein